MSDAFIQQWSQRPGIGWETYFLFFTTNILKQLIMIPRESPQNLFNLVWNWPSDVITRKTYFVNDKPSKFYILQPAKTTNKLISTTKTNNGKDHYAASRRWMTKVLYLQTDFNKNLHICRIENVCLMHARDDTTTTQRMYFIIM